MEVLAQLITRVRSRASLSFVVGALLIAGACGGNSTTGPAIACAVTPPRGTMTATINGEAFTADFSTSALIQNTTPLGSNILQINGVGCLNNTPTLAHQILITVGRTTPLTVGTYQLSAASQGQPAGSGYSGIGQYVSAPNLWYSTLSDGAGAGSGSITFTSITAARLTGTFVLSLAANSSNTASNMARKNITGSFDIPQ